MNLILKINRWFIVPLFLLPFFQLGMITIIAGICSTFLFFWWLLAVAKLGSEELFRRNLKSINLKWFYTAFFSFLLFTGILFLFGSRKDIFIESTAGILLFVLSILLNISSVLYIYYFVAKTLSLLENGIGNYRSTQTRNFYLVGLSVIGIFYFQPKLQNWLQLEVSSTANNETENMDHE